MTRSFARYGAALLVAGSLMLTACGGSSGDDAGDEASASTEQSGAAGFPLTFENYDGSTTEIPAQPERIVSTSVTLTGGLLSFDAPVVASAGAANGTFFAQWAGVAEEKGVETLWAAGSPDIESVIAAEPDLIVVSSSGADSLEDNLSDLQAIAPTIVVDYGDGTWQDSTGKLAAAAGMTEQAEATIAGFEAHVQEVAGEITVPEGSANIISYNGPGQNNQIGREVGPHAQLLEELGFTIEDPNPEWHTQEGGLRNDFVVASYENLTELTAETTFILSQDNEGAKAFLEDASLANVPSVADGQVYGLGKNSFRIDYYSATEIVDSILENFGNA
ncbi:Fe2+-enterobactin ABC transporter substrate-binding protein [Propionimicrobium sp. PCR01-08-3]|uniref:Fe2+-enterobactin ABC transporter substrate-binding protein n=1 Tax=Propionimicrobium sp. PCR01-08-3 TaxID=3052086 RepID=UPI00255CDE2D|nr:Fe2+-enterobactin ABC transporter substrate-binding protein [Propionimicrobium sp. PCR01-08-3]WIY83583.1 Fe2+-enterobactin ABC transporter substrate-binding protein [Propionimicrobium sp. PCR01-08-3]